MTSGSPARSTTSVDDQPVAAGTAEPRSVTQAWDRAIALIQEGTEESLDRCVDELREAIAHAEDPLLTYILEHHLGVAYNKLARDHGRPCGRETVAVLLRAARRGQNLVLGTGATELFGRTLSALVTALSFPDILLSDLRVVESLVGESSVLPPLATDGDLRARVGCALAAGYLRRAGQEETTGAEYAERARQILDTCLAEQAYPPNQQPVQAGTRAVVLINRTFAQLLAARTQSDVRRSLVDAFAIDGDLAALDDMPLRKLADHGPIASAVVDVSFDSPRQLYRCNVVELLRRHGSRDEGAAEWLTPFRLRLWREWAAPVLARLATAVAEEEQLVDDLHEYLKDPVAIRLLVWDVDFVSQELGFDEPGRTVADISADATTLAAILGYPPGLMELSVISALGSYPLFAAELTDDATDSVGLPADDGEFDGIDLDAFLAWAEQEVARASDDGEQNSFLELTVLTLEIFRSEIADPAGMRTRLSELVPRVATEDDDRAFDLWPLVVLAAAQLADWCEEPTEAIACYHAAALAADQIAPSVDIIGGYARIAVECLARAGRDLRWCEESVVWGERVAATTRSLLETLPADGADRPRAMLYLVESAALLSYCDWALDRMDESSQVRLAEARDLLSTMDETSDEPRVRRAWREVEHVADLLDAGHQSAELLFRAHARHLLRLGEDEPLRRWLAATSVINLTGFVALDVLNEEADALRTAAGVFLSDLGMRQRGADPASAELVVRALYALASPPIRDVVGIEEDEAHHLISIAHQLGGPSNAGLLTELDALATARGGLGLPHGASFAEVSTHALERIRAGEQRRGINAFVAWFISNLSGGSVGRSYTTRILDHLATRQVLALALVLRQPPEVLRGVAYVVAETARYVGMFAIGERWLGTMLDSYDPSTLEPTERRWYEAMTIDRLNLRVQRASLGADAEPAAAAEALDALADRCLGGDDDPERVLSLLTGMANYTQSFTDEHVRELFRTVHERLRASHAAGYRWRPLDFVQLVNAETRIAAALGETGVLSELVEMLDAVLANPLPEESEAALRRLRMTCLLAAGRLSDLRTDFERLGFIQDRRLGTVTELDLLRYPDLFEDSLIEAAQAALDEAAPAFAIDAVEQGRLRLLAALGQGLAGQEVSGFGHLPLWLLDDDVLDAAAELVRRNLTAENPTLTDDDLVALGLPTELTGPDDFPASFGWLVDADERADTFTVDEAAWPAVFGRAGWADVRELSERAGVVVYQLVHRKQARLVGVVAGGGTRVTPAVPLDADDLRDGLAVFWTACLSDWAAVGVPELRPVCVDIGGTAEFGTETDAAYEHAVASLGLAERAAPYGPCHVPTVRLATARVDRSALSGTPRLLHLGDATNTLLGPWLEAASLAEFGHVEPTSLLGPAMTKQAFHEHLPGTSIVVASCHGSFDRADALASSLGTDTAALSLTDLTASGGLDRVEFLLLASCEMGRRHDVSHEQEALSVANAALIGGCRFVVAPARPVNDLVSALLVVEFARRLATGPPAEAYGGAIRALRQLTGAEFTERLDALWSVLRRSDLARYLPWPVRAIEPIFRSRLARASADREWLDSTYYLSGY